MFVYGDPKFSVSLGKLFENFRSRVERLDFSRPDNLRSLLICAGQIEQAVSDFAGPNGGRELEAAAAHLTDCFAEMFCGEFIRNQTLPRKPIAIAALDKAAHVLASAPALGEQPVTVKVPEGYAFYALFPEQYCVTALNWARQRSAASEVLVVGVRSIGTSLSALVKETLRQAGWKVSRFTVRPSGHPFHREVQVQLAAGNIPVLIVDEGPGISGSSMAAVAEAFHSAGCQDVSFLPGHSNDPAAPPPKVRGTWRRVPRYVTPLENVKWDERSLESSLLACAQEFTGTSSQYDTVQDISGGLWQRLVCQNVEWPTSPPQFERMKYLCTARERTSVLWKFAGLHCDVHGADASNAAAARLSRLARSGYTPAPLGTCKGFIATPWIEGVRLTRVDARNTSVLRRIGNYIADAAQAGLSAAQNRIAVERIAEMLYWNTKESLRECFAEKARALADCAMEACADLYYGDGHLAPHEWIRTADGKILKLDAEGHFADHTLIGEQSVLWDIAGAWVEWNLNEQTAGPLLEAINDKGLRVDPDALGFYRAAYSAFRPGLFSLGISQVSDENDKLRFANARAFYLEQLAGVLNPAAATVRTSG